MQPVEVIEIFLLFLVGSAICQSSGRVSYGKRQIWQKYTTFPLPYHSQGPTTDYLLDNQMRNLILLDNDNTELRQTKPLALLNYLTGSIDPDYVTKKNTKININVVLVNEGKPDNSLRVLGDFVKAVSYCLSQILNNVEVDAELIAMFENKLGVGNETETLKTVTDHYNPSTTEKSTSTTNTGTLKTTNYTSTTDNLTTTDNTRTNNSQIITIDAFNTIENQTTIDNARTNGSSATDNPSTTDNTITNVDKILTTNNFTTTENPSTTTDNKETAVYPSTAEGLSTNEFIVYPNTNNNPITSEFASTTSDYPRTTRTLRSTNSPNTKNNLRTENKRATKHKGTANKLRTTDNPSVTLEVCNPLDPWCPYRLDYLKDVLDVIEKDPRNANKIARPSKENSLSWLLDAVQKIEDSFVNIGRTGIFQVIHEHLTGNVNNLKQEVTSKLEHLIQRIHRNENMTARSMSLHYRYDAPTPIDTDEAKLREYALNGYLSDTREAVNDILKLTQAQLGNDLVFELDNTHYWKIICQYMWNFNVKVKPDLNNSLSRDFTNLWRKVSETLLTFLYTVRPLDVLPELVLEHQRFLNLHHQWEALRTALRATLSRPYYNMKLDIYWLRCLDHDLSSNAFSDSALPRQEPLVLNAVESPLWLELKRSIVNILRIGRQEFQDTFGLSLFSIKYWSVLMNEAILILDDFKPSVHGDSELIRLNWMELADRLMWLMHRMHPVRSSDEKVTYLRGVWSKMYFDVLENLLAVSRTAGSDLRHNKKWMVQVNAGWRKHFQRHAPSYVEKLVSLL
ncbi:unnamed protein product [Plutella xylostella]|uniref:(diamondback moth) hypothetical protein n=1 Tax=Plutella xylostella TaxID=51655 RepID=A0A8S4EKR2_PLUXY|nr:unnamed protein product [Plutella xylostella]